MNYVIIFLIGENMKNELKFIVLSIMVASIYTAVSIAIPYISFNALQFRLAEILCILPLVSRKYIFGVTLGCFITNLIGAMSGTNLLGYMDCFIGTFATYLSLVMLYQFKNIKLKDKPILSLMMPVIINAIIRGAELAFALFPENMLEGFIISGSQIFISQFVICVVLGLVIYDKIINNKALKKIEGGN